LRYRAGAALRRQIEIDPALADDFQKTLGGEAVSRHEFFRKAGAK
jgi:hypothetical protein